MTFTNKSLTEEWFKKDMAFYAETLEAIDNHLKVITPTKLTSHVDTLVKALQEDLKDDASIAALKNNYQDINAELNIIVSALHSLLRDPNYAEPHEIYAERLMDAGERLLAICPKGAFNRTTEQYVIFDDLESPDDCTPPARSENNGSAASFAERGRELHFAATGRTFQQSNALLDAALARMGYKFS